MRAPEGDPGNVLGNHYDKYGTKNPIARALMQGFLGAVSGLYREVRPRTVLEVGCGEGLLAHHLVTEAHRPERFEACDLSLDRQAKGLDPLIVFREASIYELPYETGEFDLVVCCEVLEHLADPARGLAEVVRVSKRSILVSTPREPIWRAMNVARGKYLGDLGNTPGHIQHWGRRGLLSLVGGHARVVAHRAPLPWTVVLAEKR